MNRRRLLIANWKMNGSRAQLEAWVDRLRRCEAVRHWGDTIDVALALPFPLLTIGNTALKGLPLQLAAQNVHEEAAGAYTGEVCASMLVDEGVMLVIVGHSERRHQFGESDERIGRKVAAVLAAGMTPILCIGETEQQRDSGRTQPILEAQLRKGLALIPERRWPAVPLAYEPVWAIGTGKVATPELAAEEHAFLRGIVAATAGSDIANQQRIVYGGSVDPRNAAGLAAKTEIDGFLVGGASLDADRFCSIAETLVV